MLQAPPLHRLVLDPDYLLLSTLPLPLPPLARTGSGHGALRGEEGPHGYNLVPSLPDSYNGRLGTRLRMHRATPCLCCLRVWLNDRAQVYIAATGNGHEGIPSDQASATLTYSWIYTLDSQRGRKRSRLSAKVSFFYTLTRNLQGALISTYSTAVAGSHPDIGRKHLDCTSPPSLLFVNPQSVAHARFLVYYCVRIWVV